MINIQTYRPSHSALVERIWLLTTDHQNQQITQPPTTYSNILIPLDGGSFTLDGILLQTPHLSRMSFKESKWSYSPSSTFLGIRLYAHGLYPLIGSVSGDIDLAESQMIKNIITTLPKNTKAIPLETIAAQIKDIISRHSNTLRLQEVSLMKELYEYFRWSDGEVSLQDFCQSRGISSLTLNRRCSKIIGMTPKRYERLIKFRRALCQVIDSDLSLTDIGHETGYFDQAHFIKEFKWFVNKTPKSYQHLAEGLDNQDAPLQYNFRLL